jgi:hypothetical protein
MLSFTRFSSRLAQNALNFALILLIVDETGRAFLSSLLVLALVVPSTVAGIAAGTAADVFPKRLLIAAGDLARAGICLYFISGPGGVGSYYFVAILLATASQFASNAEGATLPAIVDRSELARANAISHAVGGGAQLLGLGVLTPVVLRLVDSPDALFAICAALFVLAACQAVLIGSTRSQARREVGGSSVGSWWLAGWRQMRADSAVMHAAIELTLITTAIIILSGLIPAYIEDVLGLPVDIGAVILMPAALGVVFGLRIAAFLAHRVPHAALSSVGFVAFVVLLGMLSIVNQTASFLGGFGALAWLNSVQAGQFDGGGVIAMTIMFPLGFAFATVTVAAQTILNDRVPLHLQGRVGSTQAAMSAICASLPVLAAGALADIAGVAPVIAIVACTIAVGAIANFREPRWLAGAPAATQPGRSLTR